MVVVLSGGARAQDTLPLQLKPSPSLSPLPRGDESNLLPSILQADELHGRPDLETVAEGNAEFRRGGMVIRADRLSYDSAQDLARARGNVRISRDGNIYEGPELQLKVQRFEGYFLQPTYFFSRTGAGGQAERVDFIDEHRAQVLGATYTSCPRDNPNEPPAWVLSSRRVRVDFDTNTGVAEGAVLRFHGVPILAAPVLSFPLTDARKSGWLPPSINLDSRSGLGLSVPYYWNIAPQRDATLTPVLSSRRGTGLNSEFRYLEPRYLGSLNLDLLPNDRVADRERHALNFQHRSLGGDAFSYRVLIQRVSDDAYWKDFPGAIASLTPRLLPSSAQAERRLRIGPNQWTAYTRVQQWQVLQDVDAPITAPYERSPQVGLRAFDQTAGSFVWSAETEFNRFTLPDLVGTTVQPNGVSTRPTGQRAHLLASVSRPWVTPGWSLIPKFTLNAASYDTNEAMADGRRRASRAISTFSLDNAWVFERDTRWFGRAMHQTLEPRLFYVNTPFRDQSSLPLFDSAPKDFNSDSIYTENPFTGVDRVADAHQLTAGVTTRMLDPDTGAETLRLGAVQRFLLREQQITPDGVPNKQRVSDLLLFGSTALGPAWKLNATVQYNPDIARVTRSLASVRYSPGPFRTVSMTHRLTRGLTEQLEFGWQWPLAGGPARRGGSEGRPAMDDAALPDRMSRLVAAGVSSRGACGGAWYGVGRINYSLRDRRVTDSILGLEYDSGCWIGRIVAERLSTGVSEATTRLMLQLELVGLSRIGSNPLHMLKDNIPGYRMLREERGDFPGPSSRYD